MKVKDIKNITLEQAFEVYKEFGIGFIIKDGKIKGLNK